VAKCAPAVSGQGGHAQTFAVARAVVWGFDLGADAGFDLLWAEYNPRCLPPWSERELRHKCADADSRPSNKPRGWLRDQERDRPVGAAGGDDAEPAPATATAAQIILAYFRERYRPAFRRGHAVVTDAAEVVPMTVAAAVPTTPLIEQLAGAADAPRLKTGDVNRDALPRLFATWSRVAWGDLLSQLPDEDAADVGAGAPTADEFRRMVADVLLTEVVLGTVIRGQPADAQVTQTERRSVIEWCVRFAKPGPWRSIRSKRCWCRVQEGEGGEPLLKVAIRHELFGQLKADPRLRGLSEGRFARLAEKYGVGTSTRDQRPHGLAAVVLDDAFVATLTAGLDADDGGDLPDG
jgi:hypothetical protein